MRRQKISELKDLKNPTCLIGEEVESKTYGKGVAFEFSEAFSNIEIMFNVVSAKKVHLSWGI